MALRIGALWTVLVLFGGLAATGTPDDTSNPAPPNDDYYELYEILVDTIDQVERNYVKPIDRRELIEAAIEGVLEKLDPYSAYIGPKNVSSFQTTIDNEFGGIGIQLASDLGQLTIFSPLVGTPAYEAGLEAGDRIVEIDGQSTASMRIDDAIQLLKGEPGTKVKLAVTRAGEKDKIEVALTRRRIYVETVLGDVRNDDDSWNYMLKPEEKIGYIRVSAFSRETITDLRKALTQLRRDGMRALILDLRFNPGGLLSSAIEVSDLFISQGRIVSTEGRNSPARSWDATRVGTFEGFPMVVLVNRYSASASEIVSACLQDHQRAVIIGERTWGKGTVQNVIELDGGRSLLKLTTAAYRRPSGHNINRYGDDGEQSEWGVSPDDGFVLRLNDRETQQLVRVRRDRDVVRPNHTGADDEATADATVEEPAEDSGNAADASTDEQPPAAEPSDEPGDEPADEPSPVTEPADQSPATEPSEADDSAEDSADDSSAAPAATDESAIGDDRPAATADRGPIRPTEPPFVDRQLQMAVDYLAKELTRIEQRSIAGRTPDAGETTVPDSQ